MSLVDKQHRFLLCVAKLIQHADSLGYKLAGAELLRTPEQAALNAQAGTGIMNSLHGLSLAIDLRLFIGGEYQKQSAAYRPLGEFWKSLDPECAWGGDFKKPDGNHFSLTHNGVR